MLSHCRVLDLTTERGLLCGQVLGDLGADVIKIEPIGGSPVRRLPPFFQDQPGPERSVYWWAYNRNKRSITLDLERDWPVRLTSSSSPTILGFGASAVLVTRN